jgi:hypothetical protein
VNSLSQEAAEATCRIARATTTASRAGERRAMVAVLELLVGDRRGVGKWSALGL